MSRREGDYSRVGKFVEFRVREILYENGIDQFPAELSSASMTYANEIIVHC